MFQSVYGVDAFFPVKSQKLFEKFNSPRSIPRNARQPCHLCPKYWHPRVYLLAKAATQVTGSLSWFDSLCSRELSESRHVLIRGCTAKIKDDLQLMAVAFA